LIVPNHKNRLAEFSVSLFVFSHPDFKQVLSKGYKALAFYFRMNIIIDVSKRQTRREAGTQSHVSRRGGTARPPKFLFGGLFFGGGGSPNIVGCILVLKTDQNI